MKTVNQIGNAALVRLLTKKNFSTLGIDLGSQQVVVCQGDAPLWEKSSSTSCHDDEYGTVDEGQTFFVWSIELGFKELPFHHVRSAMGNLVELLRKNDWPIPSHVVKTRWTYMGSRSSHSDQKFEIYRLSQAQEAKLESLRSSQASVA
jgi:hypothetical protein